jgi:hypothetical protein
LNDEQPRAAGVALVAVRAMLPTADDRRPAQDHLVRRFIITSVVLSLTLASVAMAHRMATGSTRRAIERAAFGKKSSPFLKLPQSCVLVEVTTKDGRNWATVAIKGDGGGACGPRANYGIDLAHRTRAGWRSVAGGSAGVNCTELRIPAVVRKDLELPCSSI